MAVVKVWAFAFLSSFFLFLPSLGCNSTTPQLHPHLYAGDSVNDGISRAQNHELILCKAPEMDDMVCMHYKDLQCNFQVYVLGCDKWKQAAYDAANQCNIAQAARVQSQTQASEPSPSPSPSQH